MATLVEAMRRAEQRKREEAKQRKQFEETREKAERAYGVRSWPDPTYDNTGGGFVGPGAKKKRK